MLVRKFTFIGLCLVLAACSNQASKVNVSSENGERGELVYEIDAISLSNLHGPSDLVNTTYSTSGVELSSTVHSIDGINSGGKTDGARVIILKPIAATLSGKDISVEFTLLGDSDGTIEVAYSTAESGNSGWQSFEVGSFEKTHTFEYSVPESSAKNADYLGFIPINSNVILNDIKIFSNAK